MKITFSSNGYTRLTLVVLLTMLHIIVVAQNSHQLWLQKQTSNAVKVIAKKHTPLLNLAKQELEDGWFGKAGATCTLSLQKNKLLKGDGFILDSNSIKANTEAGILYGVYELLRQQKTQTAIHHFISNPSYQRRILNHWDNMDGSVERGYAGASIFWRNEKDSFIITEEDIKRWLEYARADASIGINGAVINNVNASPKMLDSKTLLKVKAIADILRRYGITTYLAVNFSSPALLGNLKNSDPLSADVIDWWKNKTAEIYKLVPDFGGYLVKANSEGQPGPQDFGRTHADGANMLAKILQPYKGIVMWRAFVYNPNDKDRAKQAYNEFVPLDGQFLDNVIIQVKNGPIDFQPREPFSPIFGAMKKTSIMPELQVTQEYLGHSSQLAFLATMWEEFLQSDTYQQGTGSTVARITDGSVYTQKSTAIAGVANTGMDSNWCGYIFCQANWYAFGRLAWNNQLSSEQIADEWIRQTFFLNNSSNSFSETEWQQQFLEPLKQMMLQSREAVVNYSMPLGLHHLFAPHHHFGPGPWWAPAGMRIDWTPPYYHKADTAGIGFERTTTGTNALSQYHPTAAAKFANLETCPEEYLLWFHHVPWNFKMKNGTTLWDAICRHYDKGLKQVRSFQLTWDQLQPYLEKTAFDEVQSKLRRQYRDAQVYKDACLLYFQQFSRMPIPYDAERPVYDLDMLEKINPLIFNDPNFIEQAFKND